MIFFIVAALSIITFLCWQLFRAKQFNRFKLAIQTEIKPKLIKQIKNELETQRSDAFPNNDIHIEAAIAYWTASNTRMLQAALEKEIIDKTWLDVAGRKRCCQHLFFIEKDSLLNKDRIK